MFRLLQYLCALHDKCAPLCCAVGVRVVDQPEHQFVSVNGTLSLTCNVSGSEPISYQWLKDGQQLQNDGRVSGSSASVLVVDPVEGDDFGGYRCNASNDVDQVLSEVAMVAGEGVFSGIYTYVYRNVNIFSLAFPTILSLLFKHNFMMSLFNFTLIATPSPSSLTSLSPPLPSPSPVMSVVAPVIVNLTASPSTGVPQGIPLTLICAAVGGPTLNVTWTTLTGLRVGSVISVDNVTADDAGEYTCEVATDAGTINDSITVRGKSVVDESGAS